MDPTSADRFQQGRPPVDRVEKQMLLAPQENNAKRCLQSNLEIFQPKTTHQEECNGMKNLGETKTRISTPLNFLFLLRLTSLVDK